jgi:hypothetical protein
VATLNIPNTIDDDSLVEASEHQQNYDAISTFANNAVLHTDGTKGMNFGVQLLLGIEATSPLGAVTKSQLDAATTGGVDGAATIKDEAAADATTKANTAKTAAVVEANAYTDAAKAEAKTYTDTQVAAGGGGGGTVNNSTVDIYKGFVADQTGSTWNSSTSPVTVLDSASVTPSKGGYAIVTATVDVSVSSVVGGNIDTFVGELYVGGALESKNIIWRPSPPQVGDRRTISQTWIISRPVGVAFDVQLRCKQVGSGIGRYTIVGANHTFLQCLVIG